LAKGGTVLIFQKYKNSPKVLIAQGEETNDKLTVMTDDDFDEDDINIDLSCFC